jgi:nucleoside-diphosphate-sugar epimerase
MLDGFNRVHVTGGCGFIGRHLVDALVALGKDVVVVDSRLTGEVSLRPGASIAHTDIRDHVQVEQALAGAELVFHLAANASGTLSIAAPRWDFETNSVGTFNVVQAASTVGVRRFVYLSSASAYGRPQRFPMAEDHPLRPFVPYGASKLAGELTCLSFMETFGLPCVIGRPFCVYGPGEDPRTALVEIARYLRWHLVGEPIQVVGDLDRKTRDFIHVSDLVAGLLLLADRGGPGEIFNLGSGEEYSMRHVVDLIGEITGQTPTVKEISDITNDTYRLVADISKLRTLGFTPSMTLAAGISNLVSRLGPNPEPPGGSTIFSPDQQAED